MFYDTPGTERLHSMVEAYYKKANAILLIYDISNKKSFEDLKYYFVPKIEDYCKEDIPIMLLGNKADKENERKVSTEEGAALAVEYKFKFKETSCLKNENVAEAFKVLFEMGIDKYQKKFKNNYKLNKYKNF